MINSSNFVIVDIVKSKQKGAVMSAYNKFSLLLQKQISKSGLLIDSELHKAFNELKIKTLLNRSGIRKAKGYTVSSIRVS